MLNEKITNEPREADFREQSNLEQLDTEFKRKKELLNIY